MFLPPANSLSAEIHFEHLYTAVGYRNLTQKGYKWPPHPPPPTSTGWNGESRLQHHHTHKAFILWGWVKSPGWEATGRAQIGTHRQEWGAGWGKPGGQTAKAVPVRIAHYLRPGGENCRRVKLICGGKKKKREKFRELKQSSGHWKMSPS